MEMQIYAFLTTSANKSEHRLRLSLEMRPTKAKIARVSPTAPPLCLASATAQKPNASTAERIGVEALGLRRESKGTRRQIKVMPISAQA